MSDIKPIDQVLEELNKSAKFEILDNQSLGAFISLNRIKFIVDKKIPIFVVYKKSKFLRSGKLELSKESVKLPLGTMHYLYCSGLDVGYIFELPRQIVNVEDTFVSIVRTRNKDTPLFTDVMPVIKNKNINVFSSGDDAMLIISNSTKFIDIRK